MGPGRRIFALVWACFWERQDLCTFLWLNAERKYYKKMTLNWVSS